MKSFNINKGLGYLAVAAVAIAAIICTSSSIGAFMIVAVGFLCVGIYA